MLISSFICLLLFISQSFFSGEVQSRVLSSETQYIIKSADEIIVKQKSRTLIARKSDIPLGFQNLRETDFRELNSMDAIIYDIEGNELKELDDEDIKENSVSYSSIYNAHNTVYHELSYPVLPYIVENKIEFEIKSTFFLPSWNPQEKVDVDYASLEIILEGPLDFKYDNRGNINGPNITSDKDNFKHYVWGIENISKFEREYRNAPEAEFQVGVRLESKVFDLDGFRGSTENWDEFGSWYYNLIKDNIYFTSNNDVGNQFLRIDDPTERVRKIYRYLQENTRYVQIYMGIDGWRPHQVSDIHNAKYGDCKDLSIYMIALLNEVNIQACPGLVLMRRSGVIESDFPSNSFNHCIAVVPMPNDTLFLECTSDVTPINDLHSDIEGVNILLVKPNGSKLIHTPVSTAEMNQLIVNANAQIKEDRSMILTGKITATGNLAIDFRASLKNMDVKGKKQWISKAIYNKSGDIKINSFNINFLDNPDSNLYINFNASIKYFASKAGSRFIFEPDLFYDIDFDGEDPQERKMPLLNSTTYIKKDSIIYRFPNGYILKNSTFRDSTGSDYGYYTKNLVVKENGILWASQFTLNQRYISLDAYSEYFDFMEECKHKSQTKLVILKN